MDDSLGAPAPPSWPPWQMASGAPLSAGSSRTATAAKKQSMSTCSTTRGPPAGPGGSAAAFARQICFTRLMCRRRQEPMKCRRLWLKKLDTKFWSCSESRGDADADADADGASSSPRAA